ncbi:hypothetical protein ACHAPT_005989 [Fusarium lateritium]
MRVAIEAPAKYAAKSKTMESVQPSYRPNLTPSSPWPSPEQSGGPESPSMMQGSQNYRMERGTLGLDVGKGRPEDLLREGEFTHSLILLYFSNFSDIHFMFDEELFLADFATSQIPKVILYSIMALSIRSVLSCIACWTHPEP